MSAALDVALNFGMVGSAPILSTFTLNQSTDALEFIFQVPPGAASYTVTRLGIRQVTATGTPPTYRISLQGVDASGNPDGSVKSSGNAYADFAPTSGGNNTWQWFNLTDSYAASPGETLAVVVAYQSGTVDGSNNCSFTTTSAFGPSAGRPYAIQNDNGSRSRQSGSSPAYGWGTASQAYGNPINALVTSTFTSNAERALRLNVPSGWCSTYKISGALVQAIFVAAGQVDLILYDTDGTTVLQSVSVDTDTTASNVAGRLQQIYFDEAALATLDAGSTYYLSLKSVTGTNTVYVLTCASADDLGAWPGGSAATYGSRAGGSWTDDAASRPTISPILADVSGGGGGVPGARIFTGF